MKIKICAAAIVGLCSMLTNAEDKARSWSAEAEVGFLTTTGNTESSTLKSKIDAKKEFTKWLHHLVLDALYKEDSIVDDEGESQTETTAEKYFASLQSDYKLGKENASLFVFASYTDDRFSGFDFQATVALGYSDAIYKTDSSHLTYNIGPGYTVNQLEATDDSEEDTQENVVVHVAGEFFVKISDSSKFTQTVTSDVSPDEEDNTKTKAVSALSANINGSLALKLSYTLVYNSVVADDVVHLDTETGLTLVYTF